MARREGRIEDLMAVNKEYRTQAGRQQATIARQAERIAELERELSTAEARGNLAHSLGAKAQARIAELEATLRAARTSVVWDDSLDNKAEQLERIDALLGGGDGQG